jgi:cAMP-dependent protein kinase regulator
MTYIQEKVNPILEQLVTAMLLERPENPPAFMAKYIAEQQSKVDVVPIATPAAGGAEIEKVKADIARLKQYKAELMSKIGMSPAPDPEDEEEDDDDDVVEDMPPPPNYAQKGPRSSVSAEAYGQWNQKKEFTPPVYPKTDEQKSRIRSVLTNSFLFQSLDDKEMDVVILAMKEQILEPKVRIINQGDDGESLYVIEEGTLDCYKKIGEEDKLVKTCVAGDAFGELALLYNCPRAASVESRDKSTLWELDRETFNNIVKEAASKKRELYDSFLKKVPLLENVESYERMTIADALKPESFTAGTTIIRQGDPGTKFFVILEGDCVAMKSFVVGQDPQEVHKHKEGDYFGELALLKNEPRAASVVASTDVKTLTLDRATFKRLLGPLEDILRREAKRYDGAS